MALDNELQGLYQAFMQKKASTEALEKDIGSVEALEARLNNVDEDGNSLADPWRDVPYLKVRAQRDQVSAQFAQKVEADGGYEKAIKGKIPLKTPIGKGVFYGSLLEEGILPQGASDELKGLAGNIAVAKQLEKYVDAKDNLGINNVLRKLGISNPGAAEHLRVSVYNRTGNGAGLQGFALDAADNLRQQAYAALGEEKKFQDELDKGIVERKAYATAVNALYGAAALDKKAIEAAKAAKNK